MTREIMAGLGLGWAAGAAIGVAAYAADVPFPFSALFPGLVGFGVTLFWLNKSYG